MPATVRDELLPRSFMFLCLGTAALLLITQWRIGMVSPKPESVRAAVLPAKSSKAATPTPTTNPPNLAINSSAPPAANTSNVVVDLSDRRVHLYQEQHLLASYEVAIGQDGWETPTGSFYILHMQRGPKWRHPITKEVVEPGPDNPLGTRWIGFWIDRETEIGFHGTNQEELIGQAVSHGCLRMRNQDIEALYQQVSKGTPVTVRD
jgi:lipoprotein-anchoring transpeptidase ErfK/SrfK